MGGIFNALGSGLKKAGGGMQQGLDWLHQQSHDERLQRMQTETGTARAVIDAYLKDPNGPVTLQGFHDALDTVGKNLPKSHQESWKQFVNTVKAQTAPALPAPPGEKNGAQTLSPTGPQPNAPGLPAPPSASDVLGAESGGTPPVTPQPQPQAQPQAQPQSGMKLSDVLNPQAATPPMAQQPAAAPQLPVVPPSPVSEGFSTPGLTPPPVAQSEASQPPFLDPQGMANRDISIARQRFEARKAMLGPKPASMTDRQWMEVLMGQNPTPEPHFAIPGSTLSTYGDVDRQGNAVPEGTPGRRMYINGQTVFVPETGTFQSHVVTQANGNVKVVQTDRFGHIIGPDGQPTQEIFTGEQGVSPSMQPHFSSRTGEQIITTTDENGNLVQKAVPVSSSTVRTVGGVGGASRPSRSAGAVGAPGAGGAASPVTGTKPAASLPPPPSRTGPAPSRGGRVIGQSPQQTTRQWENELTAAGQKVMEESTPVLNQVNRAMGMLEAVKNENVPLADALPRLGYSLGIATDASKLINNLELGKVLGASRILKGGSRAIEALNLAMTHLPDVRKDSAKLMYEKLQNIHQNLSDIQEAAKTYESKYPGMPRGKGGKGGLPTPPAGSGMIKVRRLSDGATGSMPESNFDPAKYERQ